MKNNNSVILDNPAKTLGDPYGAILELAQNKRILNVGAAGNASDYAQIGMEQWLHAKLGQVAAALVGLDLDPREISVARNMGYDIHYGNCETENLGQKFDLIVMADVLEHVGNPTLALQNMFRHLDHEGKIVITTPNATFLGNILNGLLRRGPNVYWDHVQLYTPENIQALCDREGWRLEGTRFFSLYDRRTFAVQLKSLIVRGACALFPRFHSAFLCILSTSQNS